MVRPIFFRRPNTAIVTFSGGGAATLTRVYRWTSARFRAVEFEYDSTPDANPVNSVGTHDHPNHPAALRNEALTIDTVYRRAGFTVTNSGGDGGVPVSGAGANGTWSDAEMHDAMQIYWSRFSNAPQLVAVGVLRGTPRHGQQPRRHHVRRHRSEPSPGHGHLH